MTAKRRIRLRRSGRPCRSPAFLVDYAHMAMLDPQPMCTHLGDGRDGRHYRMAEEVTGPLWAFGVEETREAITQWP
jgi:hypothetical protein